MFLLTQAAITQAAITQATQAPTTALGQRLILTGLMVLVLIWAVFSIRKAWKSKAIQQKDIPAPKNVPNNFVAERVIVGRYLASTYANDWLARIVVYGLGTPSRAVIGVSNQGLKINLNNNREFFIPSEDIDFVKPDRAIAGRAFEKDGIAVVVWNLGNTNVATGFRADSSDQHIEFLEMMKKQEKVK
ncbi:MAG: hypothetical protein RLZZ330_308 [Actinomycetota bacterium]|jgi:hypothetical protein